MLFVGGCQLLKGYEYPHALVSSQRPSYRSEATDLPLWPTDSATRFSYSPYVGYPDDHVLAPQLPHDTVKYRSHPLNFQEFGIATPANPAGRPLYYPGHFPAGFDKLYFQGIIHKDFVTPGTVWMNEIALTIDEAELSNVEWRHFLSYLARDSGQVVANRYLPQTAHLPLPDYFTNPFYQYYPVVGLSRAQVQDYCRWRSAVVTQALADRRGLDSHDPDYMVMRYRLPTEREWEYAAGSYNLPSRPYGQPTAKTIVLINPKAAAYLRIRSQAFQSVAQVQQDILAFDKAATPIVQFNCLRQAPYFLALPTPGYVFDLPQNDFGLYQMAGNVAELVQEPGLTKGGSYRDSVAACAITARGHDTGPAPDVGFRCVCEVSFPNRH